MFLAYANIADTEIKHRIQGLQTTLQNQDIDAALILQNTDLYYFSGTIQTSHLYIPADGEPLLLTFKNIERARVESPLSTIMHLSSPEKIPDILSAHGLTRPRKLGLELDVLPVNLYMRYEQVFRNTQIVDISHDIRLLRAVKTEYELSMIAESARCADEMSAYACEVIKAGVSEIEVAAELEAFVRKKGHQGVVRMRLWGHELFYGHLMCGPSAAVPSYLASPTGGSGLTPAVAQGPGFSMIQPNQPILVDYAFVYNGYIADHTRIFSLGPLPDELMVAQQAMLDIQRRIKSEAVPGITGDQIYEMALNMAQEAGYMDYFMGANPQRVRFVGHGIGLELDEYPFLAAGQSLPLEKDMVVALEPKVIFPDKGAVGIENTHVVTEDGLKQLTVFPDDVVVIE